MKRNLRKFSSLVLVLIMLLSTVKPVYAEGSADGQSVPPAEMSQTETDENNEEAAPAESVKETPAEEVEETPAPALYQMGVKNQWRLLPQRQMSMRR